MSCLAVSVVLALAAHAGASPLAELGLADSVSLLQTEREKAQAASPSLNKDQVDIEGLLPPVKTSFCTDGNGEEGSCDSWEAAPAETKAPAVAPGVAAEDLFARDAPAEGPAPKKVKSTLSTFVSYALNALLVALVVDGIRRWRQGEERSACPEPQKPQSWGMLMQAALKGDAARCDELLAEDTPIVGSDVWGSTVLHAASKGGSAPVVKKLLERGARVDEPDSWDETPLHLAARAGHADVCELLLARGAPMDAPNAQEWTPLVVAADAEREKVCRILRDRGAGFGSLQKASLPAMLAAMLEQEEPEGDDLLDENELLKPLWPEEEQQELEDLDETQAGDW